MDFNELIADFAVRHGVEDLTVTDNAAALDIDGITVLLVSNGEVLTPRFQRRGADRLGRSR